ncbi:MAG: response regulator [Solirubrobacteraceae bacterium]
MSEGSLPVAIAVTRDQGTEGFAEEPPTVVGNRGPDPRTQQSEIAQPASRKVSVLVGSNDPFTRQALRSGASGPGIEVLAEGSVTAVAEQLAAQLGPDIVLLDVQTTAAHALGAIQQIRARVPGARILACSSPAGTEFGLLCLSAGAWGYLSKEIELAMLPRMLHALARGEAIIPRALATQLVTRFARANPADRLEPGELSPPECRLLELLRTGFTLPEAATELGVTLATARRHFGSARRKLSVPPPAPSLRAN